MRPGLTPEEQKAKEQEALDKANERERQNRDEYNRRMDLLSAKWRRIDARNAQDTEETRLGMGGLAVRDPSKSKEFPDGVYRLESNGNRLREFDVRYNKEKGTVTPLFPKRGAFEFFTDKDFKEGYGTAMDFLAGAKGCKSIHIDLEMPSEKYIMKLMNMASKRGLAVEFGEGVKKYLDEHPKKAERIYRAQEALQRYQEGNRILNDKNVDADNTSMKKHKDNLDGSEKLEGADDDAKHTNLKTKMYGADADTDLKKADKIDAELAKMNERLEKVEDGKNEAKRCIDPHAAALKDPERFIASNPVKDRMGNRELAGVAKLLAGTAGLIAGTIPVVGAAMTAAAMTKDQKTVVARGAVGAVAGATPMVGAMVTAQAAGEAAHRAVLYKDSLDRRVDKMHERNPLAKNYSSEEVVNKIEKDINNTKQNREKLLESLEKEVADLKERSKFLEKEVTKLKENMAVKEAAGPLSDDDKNLKAKIEKLEKNLEEVKKQRKEKKDAVKEVREANNGLQKNITDAKNKVRAERQGPQNR